MSSAATPPFAKVLIANRGEIAVRVIQACRELGIASVAVYSAADTQALHVLLADEAYLIGTSAPADSYLQAERILETATRAGAQAIHPGYGFLAENAEFARRCRQRGIVYVGPSAEAMERIGAKISSRRLAETLGIPVVPGETAAIEDDAHAERVATRIGYPLAIKASAGGGGRGLRVVQHAGQLLSSLARAQWEGLAYFSDATVYMERYISEPRHIEVQLLADEAGTVISLGQRECSIQRFHQKLVEEAPAEIPESLGLQLDAAAIRMVQGIGYCGAGTVEFLVHGSEFYFLEMNTRLQVEHPVTEMITGIDIVQAQLRIAGGARLWFTQEQVTTRGHAIECRINAEDPARDFQPSPMRVSVFRPPSGAGIRFDSALYAGCAVPPQYDSLLAKVIAWGQDREAARCRALRALDELIIGGPPTTVPFHLATLRHPDFIRGRLSTGFIDRLDLKHLPSSTRMLPGTDARMSLEEDERAAAGPRHARRFQVRVEGKAYAVEVADVVPAHDKSGHNRRRRQAAPTSDEEVRSPMHGIVVGLPVHDGLSVAKGTVVCVIEAMKMENEVRAPHDGTVDTLIVELGDTLEAGTVLMSVVPRTA